MYRFQAVPRFWRSYRKLTLADQNSPQGWGPSHALQPWVKQVEAATKNRVKVEVYPSQTLIRGVHGPRDVHVVFVE